MLQKYLTFCFAFKQPRLMIYLQMVNVHCSWTLLSLSLSLCVLNRQFDCMHTNIRCAMSHIFVQRLRLRIYFNEKMKRERERKRKNWQTHAMYGVYSIDRPFQQVIRAFSWFFHSFSCSFALFRRSKTPEILNWVQYRTASNFGTFNFILGLTSA